jgi:phosphatidylinositol 4-phosphatase
VRALFTSARDTLDYATMKRLFSKRKSSQHTVPVDTPSKPAPPPRPSSLRPKFVVPPLPHPCPYASIHVSVATDGLVLRPDVQDVAKPASHVKVSWGKDAVVEEIEGEAIDGTSSTTVYGIVGILRLFHGMYARSHLYNPFQRFN